MSIGELPPDPFGPAAPSDHARAQARAAAKIARLLRDDPEARTATVAWEQLIRATTEVAEYFGLNLEDP